MKLLSIQIPTICSRLKEFTILYDFLQKQVIDNKLEDKVEIIFERDNKEMPIMAKRLKLYKAAKAKFSVQIDDDDTVSENFVKHTVEIIESDDTCDYIGYKELVKHTGVEAIHSNRFYEWSNGFGGIIERTPFFKDPILTEYCVHIASRMDITSNKARFGEDHQFARNLKQSGLIYNEIFLDEIMYIYRYKHEEHSTKYGIKQ